MQSVLPLFLRGNRIGIQGRLPHLGWINKKRPTSIECVAFGSPSTRTAYLANFTRRGAGGEYIWQLLAMYPSISFLCQTPYFHFPTMFFLKVSVMLAGVAAVIAAPSALSRRADPVVLTPLLSTYLGCYA